MSPDLWPWHLLHPHPSLSSAAAKQRSQGRLPFHQGTACVCVCVCACVCVCVCVCVSSRVLRILKEKIIIKHIANRLQRRESREGVHVALHTPLCVCVCVCDTELTHTHTYTHTHTRLKIKCVSECFLMRASEFFRAHPTLLLCFPRVFPECSFSLLRA